ncbi:MAG TPA: hypothetical protein VHX59_11805 [Mycobacteriales bacterium]|jgi:hypothetical protein|nr:hypothetical protein [Mycobacteriales bacterium]
MWWRRNKDNAVLVGGPLGGETRRVPPGPAEETVRFELPDGTQESYRRSTVSRKIDGRMMTEYDWFAEEKQE